MITQVLTPFDSTKQAIEGTADFRANASYSWSWLIEHTNQQNTLIEQIKVEIATINQNTQTASSAATSASQSATNALNSKNAAKTSEDNAATSASSASQSATNALNSKNAAKTSEDNAKISEQNAANSSTLADIHSKTAKTTLVDADEMMLADSASTFSLKKITWANIKAVLSSLFVQKDSSGNVGLSTVPNPWGSYWKALDLPGGSLFSVNTLAAGVMQNAYMSADNITFKYKITLPATYYSQYNGSHTWYTAPSGTAGNVIPWTNAMTLGSNGNLLLGTSTDNGIDKLQVNGTISSGAILESYGDLNNFKQLTRNHIFSNSQPNIPINDFCYVEIIVHQANAWVMQRATVLGAINSANCGRVFVRCFINGTTWTPWVEK